MRKNCCNKKTKRFVFRQSVSNNISIYMTKRNFIFSAILILFLSAVSLLAQHDRKVENKAFGFGERLDYNVGYSFVTAGTGYFHIMPMVAKVNDKKCYDIKFRVISLESLKWIYKVDDAYRTVLDVESLLPYQFQQRIREGNYKKDAAVKFDHYNKKAYEGGKTYDVPQNVFDIVAAFYNVRAMDLAKMRNGTVFYMQNYFEGKVHKLGVKIHKRETVKVPAGIFKTIKIEPLVVDGGLFKSEGNIFIWLTDDENKMPVKVSTKILIGDVYAELTKYSGLRNHATARIK